MRSNTSRLPVALDGEVEIMHPPLQYRSRPEALRVIVPPAARIDKTTPCKVRGPPSSKLDPLCKTLEPPKEQIFRQRAWGAAAQEGIGLKVPSTPTRNFRPMLQSPIKGRRLWLAPSALFMKASGSRATGARRDVVLSCGLAL